MRLTASVRVLPALLCGWLTCFGGASAATTDSYAEHDPLEGWNRAVFAFNDKTDELVLKPVAEVYRALMPGFVNEGISNFFQNLGDVRTFGNSLLQGKLHNAVVALNRVIYNSTFGVLGLIDVSTGFGLRAEAEDFGQTLGTWGWEHSSYLMLPLLGPSTVRDFGGRVADSYIDPVRYSENIHDDTLLISMGIKIIDTRADLLGVENLLVGTDRYQFIRNAYLQNRDYLVNDGVVDDPFSDESFDDYEDF